MENAVDLLVGFLRRNPAIEKLSDIQLQRVSADIFGDKKDEQCVMIALIRDGVFYNLPSADISGIVSKYATRLNVERDAVSDVVIVCMDAVRKVYPNQQNIPQPQKVSDPASADSSRIKLPRDAKGRKEQLDAHPQKPYPRYTLWENIGACLGGNLWDDCLYPLVVEGCLFGGVFAYLLSLLFRFIGKGGWNRYVWYVYGSCMLVLIVLLVWSNISEAYGRMDNAVNQRYRLKRILAEKGYTKKAEQVMRAVYNDIRTNRYRYDNKTKRRLLLIAYQEVLEDVMCYFSEKERWLYWEESSEYWCSYLYKEYYGYGDYKVFDAFTELKDCGAYKYYG